VRAGLALVAGVMLAACVAGCGGHSDRKQLSAYIERVDTVEGRLATPLHQISVANRAFAGKKPDLAAIELRLAKARVRVAAVQRQLQAIDPPPRARHLHTLLLQLVAQENELAGEVERLAAFVPAFARAVAALPATSTELKRTLTAKTSNEVKAAGLRTYAADVHAVAARLGTLRAPAATAPTLVAQTATLEHVRAAALALADGLERKQTGRIAVLLQRLDTAAIGNRTVAAQQAEIAAIRAYDGRIRRLSQLATAINRERLRLSNTA
jgi:hypothetical protein